MSASYQLLLGDCIEVMRQLEPGSVQTCVTSPPYWGLRDYNVEGQIGLEATPAEYIAKLVDVFREVRRLLRDDGTLWLNLGDSYANDGKHGGKSGNMHAYLDEGSKTRAGREKRSTGLPPKSLIGIPWRVAFALQDDGWILRQDIIWHKPNPMPESVEDRPTTAHEYIFLLSKKPLYFYDHEAIKEPAASADWRRPYGSQGAWDLDGRPAEQRHGGEARSSRNSFKRTGSKREQAIPFQSASFDVCPPLRVVDGLISAGKASKATHRPDRNESEWETDNRNKRSVWTVTTRPYSDAHFATFPPKLIEPCVLAGSKRGDLVLDPFIGSGTTAAVALKHHRRCIGIDLNPDYLELAHDRIGQTQPVLLEVNP